MTDQSIIIDLSQLPPGWSYGLKRSIVHKGERKIWAAENERGDVDYCISDDGGWIPGVFPTVSAALEAFR